MDYLLKGDGHVKIGKNCKFGRNVEFIVSEPSEIVIGDNVAIGDNVKLVVESGNVEIGDWSTLHSSCLLLSKVGVKIGQHCWFGQNSILDGTGGLYIHNGVRVGMYSQIWTHVAAGEQIEGCTLIGENPVEIKNDAWLVGSCTVGSGITIGEKAICMNGSNITKSVSDHSVVMGVPAKPRAGLNFYKPITIEDKFKLMKEWISELQNTLNVKLSNDEVIHISDNNNTVLIFKSESDYKSYSKNPNESKFCIESKEYTKTLSELECYVMKYLSGNKARFYS